MRTTHTAAFVSLLVCAGLAAAQVVTPPGAPKPEPEAYVPPPPPEPVAPPEPPVTDIEFDTLIERDENGALIRLDQPVGLASIPRNPLIAEDQWPRVGEVLAERSRRLRELAVENTDIMLAIENGAIEEIIGVATEDGRLIMESTRELIQPIIVTQPPHVELVESGVLTERQGLMNDRIMREYQSVLLRDVADSFDPTNEDGAAEIDLIVRSAFEQQIHEIRFEFDKVLHAVGTNIDKVLPAAALEPSERSGLSGDIRAIKAALTDEGRIRFVVEMLSKLTAEQAEAITTAALDHC
ncbi:MAG: hypothetical protein AAGB51_05870 [Planctomycetota bacterium]